MNHLRERGDENSNTNNSGDSNLAKFRNLLKLEDIKGVKINSIKSTNIIYLNTNTECTQFDINVTLAVNFNVDMKIIYPRVVLFTQQVVDISKLRIHVNNDNIKHEIISCTNYLQRQRNINLALSVLKKCATLITERKLIIDMLTLQSEGVIENMFDDDGGISITCEDKGTHFKFFESLWKIQFDCRNHFVVDYIDFSITTLDPVFHTTAKPAMNMLIQPNVPYNNKVQLWWNIVQALNTSLEGNVLTGQQWGSRDFLRVRSIQEINSIGGDQLEIIESDDDEDCIVIED